MRKKYNKFLVKSFILSEVEFYSGHKFKNLDEVNDYIFKKNRKKFSEYETKCKSTNITFNLPSWITKDN